MLARREDCLTKARDDQDVPSQIRKQAQDAIEQSARREQDLLGRLRGKNGLVLPIVGRLDSRQAMIDELQILRESPNAEVRLATCDATAYYFPDAPRCQ